MKREAGNTADVVKSTLNSNSDLSMNNLDWSSKIELKVRISSTSVVLMVSTWSLVHMKGLFSFLKFEESPTWSVLVLMFMDLQYGS